MSSHSLAVIEVGNTRLKLAYVDQGEIGTVKYFSNLEGLLEEINANVNTVVLAGSGNVTRVADSLSEGIDYTLISSSDMPLKSDYDSIESLGVDRAANATAAWENFQEDALIFNFGTCITIDLVENGVYKGGNIAPGWQIRLKSMHDYTHALPMLKGEVPEKRLGVNTKQAILGGAFWGIIHEIDRYISIFIESHPNGNIIFTGGDAYKFARMMKKEIFVMPKLVFLGLYKMYLNAKN